MKSSTIASKDHIVCIIRVKVSSKQQHLHLDWLTVGAETGGDMLIFTILHSMTYQKMAAL
jgi:hypothetical protein